MGVSKTRVHVDLTGDTPAVYMGNCWSICLIGSTETLRSKKYSYRLYSEMNRESNLSLRYTATTVLL
jgi:hypothetical protein